MGISIWLYIHQITALEHGFRSLRDSMASLRRRFADSATEENHTAIKLEMDLIIGHVRILKEQAACLKQIGEQFDLAAFLKTVLMFLHKVDPDICRSAIGQVNKLIEQEDTGEEHP